MLPLKVPFLKPSEIDGAAAELLRKYSKWKGRAASPPIDVDDIVEAYLSLDFALGNLRDLLGVDDVLGATWFDEKRIRIDESLEGQEGRYCFTLAHEIGHWQLHRPIYEMEKVTVPLFKTDADKAPEPAVVCRTSQRKAPPEWQADQFAARLLMPEKEIRAAVVRITGKPSSEIDGLRASLQSGSVSAVLKELAARLIVDGKFTNVSNEAIRIRLVELKLVQDSKETSGQLFST